LGTELCFEFAATGLEGADFVGFPWDIVIFVTFWGGGNVCGFFVFGGFAG
jgi:hypothetical protein